MPLPDRFSSPCHLPFNSTALAGDFVLQSPDRDPGGAGVWALLCGEGLVVAPGAAPELPAGPLPVPLPADREPVYLGRYRGRPCRALRLPRDTVLPPELTAHSLLAPEPLLPVGLLSLGGTAGQVLHWLRNSRYCDRCGVSVRPIPGEWGRKCPGCGYAHFPHIHPCVIVLVRRPGELLLTRKAQWPAGRYSLVAGYLDLGECLEEAVAREVREETGVEITGLRYVGSQCWPFPSQMMAGFVAEYAGGEVRVDEDELEDARWFPRDALPSLPPRRSIARYILDCFGTEC